MVGVSKSRLLILPDHGRIVLNSSLLKQSVVRQLSKAPVVGCPAPAVCVGGGLTWRDHRGEGGRGLCGAGYCKRKELLESANPLLNIT